MALVAAELNTNPGLVAETKRMKVEIFFFRTAKFYLQYAITVFCHTQDFGLVFPCRNTVVYTNVINNLLNNLPQITRYCLQYADVIKADFHPIILAIFNKKNDKI